MIHEGHRKRMFERIESGDSLQEHEILEVLLYPVIPRRNTNDIAHNLIDTFGNLNQVLHADLVELKSVDGIGDTAASFLKMTGLCLDRSLTCRQQDPPSAYNFTEFSEYIRARFTNAVQEYVELYSVKRDGATAVLCKRFSSDESENVRISPKQIAEFIADFKPQDVILVHNHLCYNSNPSEQDDFFTRYMSMILSLYNSRLIDHYIVSPAGVYSYFTNNRIEEIRTKFNARNLMELLG